MQWPEVSKSIGNLVGPIPFHCGEKKEGKCKVKKKPEKTGKCQFSLMLI